MRTLLILAPHPDLAEVIRSAIDAGEYRVVHRANTQDAEPLLKQGTVDFCIVDAESSNVQGLWEIEKVRNLRPTCPLLVYTGTTPWEWEEEAFVQGVSHVLAKPVRPRLLKTLLERLFAPPVTSVVRTPTAPRRLPIGNPALADPVRTPIRTLEVVRDFSRILTHSLCAESMLKQFLLLLREILGVNRAAIFLRPPANAGRGEATVEGARQFRSACAIGIASGVLEQFELSTETGLGAFLYQQGRIVRRDRAEAWEDERIQKEFEILGAQVAIPILDRERLVGAALLDGRVTGEPLANAELELIFHLLEQLGLAVKNIWLHDQVIANHAMMSDILHQLSSACVVVNRDLAILHCNKPARRHFGKTGRRDDALEFSDLPQVLGSKVYQVLRTGTAIAPFKYQPADRPGAAYYVTIFPFQQPDAPAPSSALLVAEDHTQKEQLQRLEIEASNLRLVKAMADRLAHEVGNALVPLSTHQQLLTERYKEPEFRASLGVALSDSVKRVTRLINQWRFLARDAVEMEEAFPLGPLLEEAYHEAQKHQPVKSAKLVLAPGSPPAVLKGDRGALKHAFAEVLLNALQANPSDPRITVRVQSEPKGNGSGDRNVATPARSLHIDIQDNGEGFSQEAFEKVPQPFFTTRNVGLGLGMTVSRKIIETHRGQLSVLNPKSGHAGLVRISLPLEGAAAEKPAS